MKRTKKLLCLLLIVAAAMWLVPTMVFADDESVTSAGSFNFTVGGDSHTINYDLQGMTLNTTIEENDQYSYKATLTIQDGYVTCKNGTKAVELYNGEGEPISATTTISGKTISLGVPKGAFGTNNYVTIKARTYKLVHDSQSMTSDGGSMNGSGLTVTFTLKNGYTLPYSGGEEKNFEVKYGYDSASNLSILDVSKYNCQVNPIVATKISLTISSDVLAGIQGNTIKITNKAYKLETALEGFQTTQPTVEVTENDPYPCTLKISNLEAKEGYSLSNKTIKVMTGQNYANTLTEGEASETSKGYVCEINDGKVTLKINFNKIENNNVKIVANAYKFDVSYELNDGFETPKAEIDVNNSGITLLKISLKLKDNYMPNEYRVNVLTGSDQSELGKDQDQGYMYREMEGSIDIQIPVKNIKENKVKIVANALYVEYSLGENVEIEEAQVGNGNYQTLKSALSIDMTHKRKKTVNME